MRVVGIALLIFAFLSGCTKQPSQSDLPIYVTEYGLGPDKWATAWLLTRHVSPESRLVVTEPRAEVTQGTRGIVFDTPTSEIRRIGNRSAFEVAKSKYDLNDPVLNELASLVYEIEVNFWAAGGAPEADLIEEAYRELQYQHGRGHVQPKCYLAFFDRVFKVLKDARQEGIPFTSERLSMGCEDLIHAATAKRDLVPEVPIVDVLSAAAAGRKVVFVDVREPDEYSEAHIPGALNIPLRAVDANLRMRLADADYVVSYCVKDFRGFEMAKALVDIGVPNSVIMRPYGIKGWVALGLPITGTRALGEVEAEQILASCLVDPGACLGAQDSEI